MIIASIIASVSAITACSQVLGDKVVRIEYRTVPIVEIDPPKHFYVTINDSGTPIKIWGGKYCTGWEIVNSTKHGSAFCQALQDQDKLIRNLKASHTA